MTPISSANKAEVAKQNRHKKLQDLKRNAWRDDTSLLQQVHDLGGMSDAAVIKNKAADLLRNRAFAEHQQKLWGAIDRLADLRRGGLGSSDAVARVNGVRTVVGRLSINPWRPLPRLIQALVNKAAFTSMSKGN